VTAERWMRLKELYEAVLERPAEDRSDFVARVCQGDPEMDRELQRLLAHSVDLDRFLEIPVESRTFHDGELVAGRFQISSLVGKGGMGEVYAAVDTALGAPVALKAVLPAIARDGRNVDRLLREIQLARIVTHPNVCRVYDLERHPRRAARSYSSRWSCWQARRLANA
jgi:serine/threonine protein kinase